MIRILNAEPNNYSPEARQILTSIGELVERPLSQAELPRWVADFDVLIVRLRLRVNREVIEAGRRLRAIVTATTGLDHIDVESAQARGIAVLSLKGEVDFLRSIPATAEHTWALLLALMRHIPQAFESVRAGEWNRDAFRGRDLARKRLGIVGLGRVGERVAQYGLAFRMQVAAYDPYRSEWPEEVCRWSTLEDLLRHSDILLLHVPLNVETYHLIGERELALLPRGAVLVNTARGAVVDEKALLAALKNGRLRGAALDVIEDEFSQQDSNTNRLVGYAREHDNLLITPHLGGATVESMAETEIFMAKKLRDFIERRNNAGSL